MIKHCPNCQSEQLIILDFAKKSEAVIGMGDDAAADISTNAMLEEENAGPFFDKCQCLDCGYEFNCRSSGIKQRLNNPLQNLNQ
jgi:hypothetical protein